MSTGGLPEAEVTNDPVTGEFIPRHIRQIQIRPVINGFVVQIGCQEFVVVGNHLALSEFITNYTSNPRKFEVEARRTAVNKSLLERGVSHPAPPSPYPTGEVVRTDRPANAC